MNNQLRVKYDAGADTPKAKNIVAAIDVFISHSSQDAAIAEALIDLLRISLSIPSEKIRCTSVDGYRLPVGASTEQQLRNEVHDATVFIGLITQASLESAYVLFELGARWGAGLRLVPLLASGADPRILKAPLSGLNVLSCDVPAQIHQLVNDLAHILKVSPASPSTCQNLVYALVDMSRTSKEKKILRRLSKKKAQTGIKTRP